MAEKPVVSGAAVRRDTPAQPDDAAQVVLLKGAIAVGGILDVREVLANLAPTTVVPASVVTVDLLVANLARRNCAFFNYSRISALFLKLGTLATPTMFTCRLPPMSYYVPPDPGYTGVVTGVWEIVDPVGTCLVTELI